MGRFIVFEGLDGSGTTTQAQRLVASFRADDVPSVLTCEPTDGPIGRSTRAILAGAPGAAHSRSLPLLFAADRADHVARVVQPALDAGDTVVCDRYIASSLAYQALEHDYDDIWLFNRRFPAAHCTVFLDVPVDVAMDRIRARGEAQERFEHAEALQRIAALYARALDTLRNRGDEVHVIDGTRAIETVADDVRRIVACAS